MQTTFFPHKPTPFITRQIITSNADSLYAIEGIEGTIALFYKHSSTCPLQQMNRQDFLIIWWTVLTECGVYRFTLVKLESLNDSLSSFFVRLRVSLKNCKKWKITNSPFNAKKKRHGLCCGRPDIDYQPSCGSTALPTLKGSQLPCRWFTIDSGLRHSNTAAPYLAMKYLTSG